MKDFKEIIESLTIRKETLATMESCTGGGVANALTNIDGASKVLKFSAITYSNEYKIKMGVSSKVIDEFSVYSIETAHEMAKNISEFAHATYGIGITGKLNRADEFNNYGADNEVFVSIYSDGNFYDKSLKVGESTRALNKELVIDSIIEMLGSVINEKNKES